MDRQLDKQPHKQLPARPNLDHLRGQAKTLLAELKHGNASAVRAFLNHLPAARGLKPGALRTAKLRLADAQSVVARQCGFDSWAVLVRHVEQLRGLEGEWRIARLEVDGRPVPDTMLGHTRILIDGDRFRTESPESTYEGNFAIETEASPPHFDIHFVAGPEAGNTSYGIYKLESADRLTLCLGLVHATRPQDFASRPGSGHALEHLLRASAARPAHVTGGTPPTVPDTTTAQHVPASRDAAAAPDDAITPLLERLQGEWSAVELITDGKSMPETWLRHGSRTMTGNEVKVVFGGQTMIHAKVSMDDTVTPIAIDYVNLLAKQNGAITHGIMEWVGDDVRFLMAPVGAPRPVDFSPAHGRWSRWRRR